MRELENDAISSSSEAVSVWSYTSVVLIRLRAANSDDLTCRPLCTV